MKTVAKETQIKFEEKKSKYIGYIKPVITKKEAEDFIIKIKKKHPDASHNPSAYKVIEKEREYFKFSDDGEPQNTAGKPMAELINLMKVNNLVIVATRYFGGIKLGAGGLIRSYVKAGKLAIIESGIIEYKEKIEFMIEFDYKLVDVIDKILENEDTNIMDKNYGEKVTYKIETVSEIKKGLELKQGVLIV